MMVRTLSLFVRGQLIMLMAVGLGVCSSDLFVDVAGDAGIDFTHFNGMSGAYYIVETMGAGCALFDYDNDGDLDVYLVQGKMLGSKKNVTDAIFPPSDPLPLGDALFRNDGDSNRLSFVNVTKRSGIRASGYGMGVTVGDYDNDGFLDLYLTNYGPNQLWRNRGDGTFVDVSLESGTQDERYSDAAVFFDYDSDGWLDLFVGNYIKFNESVHKKCPTNMGADGYCGPSAYVDEQDRLYRNLGNGRFVDVSRASGIVSEFGAALGVIAADFNADHLVDLYVANDADPNLLWLNQGDGTFINDALLAGCAVNAVGAPEASMGVDAEDFDGDGDLDLFMTHLAGETHTLYLNDGSGFFEDRSQQAGLGTPSKKATGFGTAWFDYDNDGWLDLLVVNGNVYGIEALIRAKDPYPLHQPNQLFHNNGQGRFVEVSKQAGAVFSLSEVSRGAAFGDIDNDGDTDVLITNNSGPARLLLNQVGNKQHYLGVRLVSKDGRRDAIGASLCVVRSDGKQMCRRVRRIASYASSNDARVLFGLGKTQAPLTLSARYGDGSEERWQIKSINQYIELKRGSGASTP